jgi:hypothetical protein
MSDRKTRAKATRDAELVSAWLSPRYEGEDHTPELQSRRKRMLAHPRMPSVIRKLTKLADPDEGGDDVRAFLEFSFALPELWEFRKTRPKEFVSAETKDLATHAAAFRLALKQHFGLVNFYLEETREEGKRPSSPTIKQRFDLLFSAVTSIHDQAAAERHYLVDDDIPPPPKEPGHHKAREQFCIRGLAWEAQQLFAPEYDEHLMDQLLGHLGPSIKKQIKARDAENQAKRKRLAKGEGLRMVIAVLVSTALGLKEPLTPESVTQFLRHYKYVPRHLL